MLTILLLCTLAGASSNLSIIVHQNPVFATVNQSVLLPVSYHFSQPQERVEIRWSVLRNNRHIVTTRNSKCSWEGESREPVCGSQVENKEPEYSHRVLLFGNASLLIQDVGLEDAGSYVVSIQGSDVVDTKVINVSVTQDTGVSSNLSIIVHQNPVFATVNQSVLLPVSYHFSQPQERVEIRWSVLRNNRHIVTTRNSKCSWEGEAREPVCGGEVENKEPEYSHRMVLFGNASLLIQDVGLEDAGSYVVSIQGSYVVDTKVINVSVTQGASSNLSIIVHQNPVFATVNQSVLLPVSYRFSQPQERVEIRWSVLRNNRHIVTTRNSKCSWEAEAREPVCGGEVEYKAPEYSHRVVLFGNASLLIQDVGLEDAGSYVVSIQGSDVLGTKVINVSVTQGTGVSSNLSIIVHQNLVFATVNQSVLLPVSYHFSQPQERVEIRWSVLRNNRHIVTTRNSKCSWEGEAREPVCGGQVESEEPEYSHRVVLFGNASLLIQEVGLEDAGSYVVSIQSSYVLDTKVINVSVTQGTVWTSEPLERDSARLNAVRLVVAALLLGFLFLLLWTGRALHMKIHLREQSQVRAGSAAMVVPDGEDATIKNEVQESEVQAASAAIFVPEGEDAAVKKTTQEYELSNVEDGSV
ncbi:pregnancy-specific glycoprotein 22-like [Lissotriton helveticus]